MILLKTSHVSHLLLRGIKALIALNFNTGAKEYEKVGKTANQTGA